MLKRKTISSTKKASAMKALQAASDPIGSMEDLAKNFTRSDLSPYTMQEAFKLFCEQARRAFAGSARALHLKHPAIPFLKKAADALDRAECLTRMALETCWGQGNDAGGQGRVYRETCGAALLSFVSESGRWMERAQDAIDSGEIQTGWTAALVNVEGLPESAKLQISRAEAPRG